MGLSQFIVQQYIKHLGRSAERKGGHQTASYSQCLEPVNSMIGRHKTSREGICEATSARWIVLHARGSSLFNWIYKSDGKINPAAIVNLAINQIEGETRERGQSGQTDQDWFSEMYLWSHGIARRNGLIPQNNYGYLNPVRSLTEGDKSAGDVGEQLAHALVAPPLVTGYYVMIGIHGKSGGHCMAAFVGQDVCFFDPNFGEYWFPKRADFVRWFTSHFWLAYRIGGLNSSFALREYAPKMGFVTKHGQVADHLVMGKY